MVCQGVHCHMYVQGTHIRTVCVVSSAYISYSYVHVDPVLLKYMEIVMKEKAAKQEQHQPSKQNGKVDEFGIPYLPMTLTGTY